MLIYTLLQSVGEFLLARREPPTCSLLHEVVRNDARGNSPTDWRYVLVATFVGLAFFTNLPQISLAVVLASTSFLMICLPGRFVCLMAWFTIVSHPQSRGAFMSLISTTQQLAIGFAALLGGLLVVETPSGGIERYWLAGLVAIAANLVVLLLTPYLARLEKSGATLQP